MGETVTGFWREIKQLWIPRQTFNMLVDSNYISYILEYIDRVLCTREGCMEEGPLGDSTHATTHCTCTLNKLASCH